MKSAKTIAKLLNTNKLKVFLLICNILLLKIKFYIIIIIFKF